MTEETILDALLATCGRTGRDGHYGVALTPDLLPVREPCHRSWWLVGTDERVT